MQEFNKHFRDHLAAKIDEFNKLSENEQKHVLESTMKLIDTDKDKSGYCLC